MGGVRREVSRGSANPSPTDYTRRPDGAITAGDGPAVPASPIMGGTRWPGSNTRANSRRGPIGARQPIALERRPRPLMSAGRQCDGGSSAMELPRPESLPACASRRQRARMRTAPS